MTSEISFEEVERARRDYSRLLLAYQAAGNRYLDVAPKLEARHIANCRMLPDRMRILEMLPAHSIVAEVGVDQGLFSAEILKLTTPSALHLIDIDLDRLDRPNVQTAIDQGVVHLHEGDSASILGTFEDTSFDWIYIDGDHGYEGVRRDIEQAVKKVKPDGRLVFNDYTVWSPRSMMHCGVARAVNELCLEDGWELEWFCFQGLFYNDVVLRKL